MFAEFDADAEELLILLIFLKFIEKITSSQQGEEELHPNDLKEEDLFYH